MGKGNEKLSLKGNIKAFIWITRLSFSFNKFIYGLFIVSEVLSEIIPVLITFFAAQVISQLASGTEFFSNEILFYLVSAFALTLLRNLLHQVIDYSIARFNYIWDIKAWELFLNKSASLDFQYLESPDFNIMQQKVREAVNWRGTNVALYAPDLISSFLSLILISGILFSLNPIFVIAIVSLELVRFMLNRKFGKSLYSFWDSKGETKHHASYAQGAFENEDVVRESKIYGFAKVVIGRYKKELGDFYAVSTRNLNNRTIFRILMTLFDDILNLIIQVWLITKVFAKQIDIGGYSFYLANISTVAGSLNKLQTAFSWLSEQLPFISELRDYLELPDLIDKAPGAEKLFNVAPEIEFKNVTFKYPGTEKVILKDVSFKINAGDKVALVGENGAGKTTIIKLLARFYDVTSGEILINNVNIKKIDLASYYKLWGVLFQSFAKLWFSVRENIGIGNLEDIDNLDMIKQAAQKADADAYISKLPKQYETLLSRDFKGGVEPSGGQWQKIGIARAMFASPKLIVLDEPTSALDALAEAEVFANIHELSKESTIVMISHRFATVRNANMILVLKDGEILEQGNHEELLKNNQLYAKMFNEQAKGYK